MATRKASAVAAEPTATSSGDPYGELMHLPVDQIIAGAPGQNVRERFDPEALERLAQSIREQGILEPLVVRFALNAQGKPEFHLVAGERRLRAARMADLTHVPAIVREIDPTAAAKLNILENLQRQDLDPIEEARGYQRLIEDHGMRAKAIAEQLGVSESHISNRRRLLRLPGEVAEEIWRGNLSASVALSLVDIASNPDLAAKAAADLIKVRATQEHAAEVITTSLLAHCPTVSEASYWGNRPHTCDPEAHKDCACRRHAKSQYVVCIDPKRYAEIEVEAAARLGAAQAEAVAKAEAEAGESGIIDVDALNWRNYGQGHEYEHIYASCESDHEHCTCRRMAVEGRGEQPFPICVDPKEFAKVERTAKKAREKAARVAIAEENGLRSAAAMKHVLGLRMWADEDAGESFINLDVAKADLAYLATIVWLHFDPDYSGPGNSLRVSRKAYMQEFGIAWDDKDRFEASALAEKLMAMPTEALLRVIFEWPAVARMPANGYVGHESLASWLLGKDGTPDDATHEAS